MSIHKILDKIKRLKIENVILEASSHGLKQHRLNCINFKRLENYKAPKYSIIRKSNYINNLYFIDLVFLPTYRH